MMHATAEELELYVTAQLPAARAEWFERHCDECAACARAVANEARLELSLTAMAAERRCGMRADVRVAVEAPKAEAPRRAAFFALAAAACVLLAFVTARLPHALSARPAAQQLFTDAGDLAKVSAPPGWTAGTPSGGTP